MVEGDGGHSGPLFPALSASEVHAATKRRWNTSGAAPVPVGDWLVCPICRGRPQIRWWKWHQRPSGHTVRHRCDVSVKCTDCAHVWLHGVALDPAAWNRRPAPRRDKRIVKWREVRKVLTERS